MCVQANQNSWERRETEVRKINMPGGKGQSGWGRKRKGNDAVNGKDVMDRWVKTNLTTMCEHILSFVAGKK